jgi:hypothetical protein
LGIVEVLGASRGQIPLIIEDLDVYRQLPSTTDAPTLNSEEPGIRAVSREHSPVDPRTDRCRRALYCDCCRLRVDEAASAGVRVHFSQLPSSW